MYTKRALIHDTQGPPGQRGPMHIDCECGRSNPVPYPFTDALVRCQCGIVYDSRGWIQERPAPKLACEQSPRRCCGCNDILDPGDDAFCPVCCMS